MHSLDLSLGLCLLSAAGHTLFSRNFGAGLLIGFKVGVFRQLARPPVEVGVAEPRVELRYEHLGPTHACTRQMLASQMLASQMLPMPAATGHHTYGRYAAHAGG